MTTKSPIEFDLGLLTDFTNFFKLSVDSCYLGVGGYGEVYKCNLGEARLAVKIIRRDAGEEGYQKRFHNELKIWAPLRHENILKLDGIYRWMGDRLGFVSVWQEHGSVENYVKDRPECDIMNVIFGSAKGLRYLHNQGVIHGDLHKGNILVSSAGEAKLADFGNSKIVAVQYSRTVESGNLRRLPREFTDITPRDENDSPLVAEPRRSRASDVWSWAITMQEAFTGDMPYFNTSRDVMAMMRIRNGDLPTFPGPRHDEWFPYVEKLAGICCKCWAGIPDSRPSMEDVCIYLSQDEVEPEDEQSESSLLDEDSSEDSGDESSETPRVRPIGDVELDGLTGSIGQLSLSNSAGQLELQADNTASQALAAPDASSARPQLHISIPTNSIHRHRQETNRNATITCNVWSSRRRQCHINLLNELLDGTPCRVYSEEIGSAAGPPKWIGRIIIGNDVYGFSTSETREDALDLATYDALRRLQTERTYADDYLSAFFRYADENGLRHRLQWSNRTSGPGHKLMWSSTLTKDGIEIGSGSGRTKRRAEDNAARCAALSWPR